MSKSLGWHDRNFSRHALLRSYLWAPQQTVGSTRWTGAATPTGIPAQHWTLFDAGSTVSNTGGTGSFESRTAGWQYFFSDKAGSAADGQPANGGALRGNQRFPWMTDLCIHIGDAAGSDLELTLEIRGKSPVLRDLRETVTLVSGGTDTYARTHFAYLYVESVKILHIANAAAGDYLEIGFDERDLTGAAESDRKIGIPYGAAGIKDLAAVKVDMTDVGTGATQCNNSRGIHAVDLVQDGAVWDPDDNSLVVNTATELTRAHIATGNPANFTLDTSPTLSRHAILFQVDPVSPASIPLHRSEAFHSG